MINSKFGQLLLACLLTESMFDTQMAYGLHVEQLLTLVLLQTCLFFCLRMTALRARCH